MLRVAMVSKWHPHARGYGETLRAMPDVKVTTVWDEVPARGEEWATTLEADWVPDYAALLKRDDVDAICCNAPTNRHAELMIAAANAGKHIFTEKVMALTIDECNAITEAVNKNKVTFCISFPFLTRAEVRYAKQAVEDGLIGRLVFIRVRIAHDGGSAGWLPEYFWGAEECGGGAMMDLGAHPMYLLRWFGGQPKRVSSTFNYIMQKEVEDNAISTIEFESGCLGVAETSFMSTYSPFSLELSGTEGSIVVGGPDEKSVRIRSRKLNEGKSWITPEKLPDPLPNPAQLWVNGILRKEKIPFGLEEGTQLTELMQHAYLSHLESKQIEIPKR